MFNSVQGGFIGNAGAPDTTVAGTWIRDPFPQGQQPELDQLWRRGMQETERGRQMQENIQRLRQTLPQAMGMPGMNIGNIGGMSAAMDPSTGTLQEQETQRYPSVNNQGAFSPWAVMQASARKAGFDKKTVS